MLKRSLGQILADLPEKAFKDNPKNGQFNTEAPVIAFKKGENGYYPVFTDFTAAELNAGQTPQVTKAQAEAMYMGSLFGWDVPAADPLNYDEEGNLK